MIHATALYLGLILSNDAVHARPAAGVEFWSEKFQFGAKLEPKLGDRSGYRASGDFEWGGRVKTGFSYRYRSDDAGMKHSFWPRVSIGPGPLKVVLRQEVGSRKRRGNSVVELQLSKRTLDHGHFTMRGSVGIGSYFDPSGRREWGGFVESWVGVRW